MIQNVDNVKITLNMVKYWLGGDIDEGVETLRDIANSSHNGHKPWTPDMLYNDIIKTWEDDSIHVRIIKNKRESR